MSAYIQPNGYIPGESCIYNIVPQSNIWCIAVFKHGRYAIIEENIESLTLAKSKALKHAKLVEYLGCLVREVKSELLDKNIKISIEELLK